MPEEKIETIKSALRRIEFLTSYIDDEGTIIGHIHKIARDALVKCDEQDESCK